jgi:hypothetical protein
MEVGMLIGKKEKSVKVDEISPRNRGAGIML